MEKKYHTAGDVATLIGSTSKSKAYALIKQCNDEIKELYKDKPANEQPIIINGRVNKSYFDKKMEILV